MAMYHHVQNQPHQHQFAQLNQQPHQPTVQVQQTQPQHTPQRFASPSTFTPRAGDANTPVRGRNLYSGGNLRSPSAGGATSPQHTPSRASFTPPGQHARGGYEVNRTGQEVLRRGSPARSPDYQQDHMATTSAPQDAPAPGTIVTSYPDAQRRKKKESGGLMNRAFGKRASSGSRDAHTPTPVSVASPPKAPVPVPTSAPMPAPTNAPMGEAPSPTHHPLAAATVATNPSPHSPTKAGAVAGQAGALVAGSDPVLARISPDMFGIVVQGCQPITEHSYSGDKVIFRIPQGLSSTSTAFYICTYVCEYYRMLPYSYVDISVSLQGEEWSKMGRLDHKQTSMFLTFPALAKEHDGKVGLSISGPLPRELKPTQSILPDAMNRLKAVIQAPDFDPVEARKLLIHLPHTPKSPNEYLLTAVQRLDALEQISRLPSGKVYINQLRGVCDWLQEQVLNRGAGGVTSPEEQAAVKQCSQRLWQLKSIRPPDVDEEMCQYAEETFSEHFNTICGEIMSKATKVPQDPAQRLQAGQGLVSQFEANVGKEVGTLDNLAGNVLISRCLRKVNNRVQEFFGWVESTFVDSAPAELRMESKKLNHRINFISDCFEKGVPFAAQGE